MHAASYRLLRSAVVVLTLATACIHVRPLPAAGPDLTTEAGSLLGRTLERPRFDDTTDVRLRRDLSRATDSLRMHPASADALIWVGRRLAYLGKYREAIDTFSAGVTRYPQDARFLRHRGHRYLTIRRLGLAIADLSRAGVMLRGHTDVMEPDGVANADGTPVSTLQFNVWYHLGLAHYVQGEWKDALAAYDECAKVSINPDLKVATAYWRYLTLRRMGREAEAEVVLQIATDNPIVIENGAYLRLLRLFAALEPVTGLRYANGNRVADATTAYGVSMWHLLNGRHGEAAAIWRTLNESVGWSAFGVLASEGELAFKR